MKVEIYSKKIINRFLLVAIKAWLHFHSKLAVFMGKIPVEWKTATKPLPNSHNLKLGKCVVKEICHDIIDEVGDCFDGDFCIAQELSLHNI